MKSPTPALVGRIAAVGVYVSCAWLLIYHAGQLFGLWE